MVRYNTRMPNHTRTHHYFRGLKKKQPFDFVVYFFMVATPLFELPQLYAIYSDKDSSGVSILTWGFFLVASVVWFMYALKKRLRPLLVTNSLYFVIELAIVTGIIMYQ
jgi:uncharacterized protein with PQ loop repeat